MDRWTVGADLKGKKLVVHHVPQLRNEVQKAEGLDFVIAIQKAKVVVLERETSRIRIGEAAVLDVPAKLCWRARLISSS